MTVKNNAIELVLVLQNKILSAWQQQGVNPIKSLEIRGEPHVNIRDKSSVKSALANIFDRLKDENQDVSFIHWIVDESTKKTWLEACHLEKNVPWQQFSSQWLCSRFGVKEMSEQSLKQQVIPWLISVDEAKERAQMQAALEQHHQNESSSLAAQRAALEKKNQQLRAENNALLQVDSENLVRFLPALFPQVFTVLGAHDLALLCGRVEPLNIPNPFPEPTEATLRTLQRAFCALPLALQSQIVGFVANLPQRRRLKPRPEMREQIEELEQGLL